MSCLAIRIAAFTTLLLLEPVAHAQVLREAGTLYFGLGTGATAYGGEYDGTGGTSAADNAGAAWLYRDLGVGLGADGGYQLTPVLGARMGLYFGRYANLDRADGFNPLTGTTGQRNDGEGVVQLQALLRVTALPRARVTPYALAGAALALGQGEGMGYGPAAGAGVEYVVSPRMAVFAEAHGAVLFPDAAVDGFDPSGQGYELADNVDYDALTHYGVGVRYVFRPGAGAPRLLLVCPERLGLYESGTFTAEATPAPDAHWDFGDGATAEGRAASHAFERPGTFAVTFTVRERGREASAGCDVLVEARGEPPVVEACAATPARVAVGALVAFSAASSDARVRWDFGDGASAEAAEAEHAYDVPGAYEATLTASNAAGAASCRALVSVGTADEVFCEGVRALEPVYFSAEMDALPVNARERLAENVERLRRCPALCVRLGGYTDGVEQGPNRALRRAEVVRDYYAQAGIDPARVEIATTGLAPDADDARDPLPGDRRARRVESVPVVCNVGPSAER
jgi:PKD repeat protein